MNIVPGAIDCNHEIPVLAHERLACVKRLPVASRAEGTIEKEFTRLRSLRTK